VANAKCKFLDYTTVVSQRCYWTRKEQNKTKQKIIIIIIEKTHVYFHIGRLDSVRLGDNSVRKFYYTGVYTIRTEPLGRVRTVACAVVDWRFSRSNRIIYTTLVGRIFLQDFHPGNRGDRPGPSSCARARAPNKPVGTSVPAVPCQRSARGWRRRQGIKCACDITTQTNR